MDLFQAKISADDAIRVNAELVIQMAMEYAVASLMQLENCKHKQGVEPCDNCKRVSDALLTLSLGMSISGNSLTADKAAEFTKTVVAFAKENLPEFPYESFEEKGEFPDVIFDEKEAEK